MKGSGGEQEEEEQEYINLRERESWRGSKRERKTIGFWEKGYKGRQYCVSLNNWWISWDY